MKKFVFLSLFLLIFSVSVFAQRKGIDNQTEKIRTESAVNDRDNDVGRGFDFGKGKTKIRKRLSNPYRITSRRDFLVNTILGVIREQKLILDEQASRTEDGFIVTKPFVFSKGVILTTNELNRYADVPGNEQVWTRGRYSLVIDVKSIDGIQNDVLVSAKVEGRSENGIFSEWSTLSSSGEAEEEFLSQLVQAFGKDLNEEGRKP